MFGKRSKLNSLAERKKLLLLESDLNRVLLQAEVAGIKREFQQLVHRAGSVAMLAALATQAGAAVQGIWHTFSRRDHSDGERKSSWLSKLMRGVRMGGVLWSVLRSAKR